MGATNNPALWAERIAQGTRRLGLRVLQAEKDTVSAMADALVDNSPVRSGQFRANWQHGINVAPYGVLELVDPTGADTKARLRRAIAVSDPGLHVFVNNLPYARRIEFGWSPQAPQGVVGVTVLQFGGQLAASMNRSRA